MIFLNFLLLIIFATNLSFTGLTFVKQAEIFEKIEDAFSSHLSKKHREQIDNDLLNTLKFRLFDKVDDELNIVIDQTKIPCLDFFEAIIWMGDQNSSNKEALIKHITNSSKFCENIKNALNNETLSVRICMGTMQNLFDIMKRDERITSDPILIKKEFLDLALSIIQSLTGIK